MPYKAVIFDLYGTLVENFSSQAYDQVQEQMAKTLDIPYPKFRQVMLETSTINLQAAITPLKIIYVDMSSLKY